MSERAKEVANDLYVHGYAGVLQDEALVIIAAAIEQTWKDACEAMREAAITALHERVRREEYGHAKAAVTLDIEAIHSAPVPPVPK